MRLLVADDHEVMRGALVATLRGEPLVEVVGEARDGREAVAQARALQPDIVLMDYDLPHLDGLQATAQIVAELPECRVLILSAYAHAVLVQQAFDAGASGYLRKTCAWQHLREAVTVLAGGGTYLDPQVAETLAASTRAPELSEREREVLALIADGLATKQIASRLGISVKTVESHRANLMAKLGLDSVAKLTKYALREGIATLDL